MTDGASLNAAIIRRINWAVIPGHIVFTNQGSAGHDVIVKLTCFALLVQMHRLRILRLVQQRPSSPQMSPINTVSSVLDSGQAASAD